MSAPTALIAEDEPLLAQSLRDDLAVLWPELQVAAMVADGESALQQALAHRPSVCFFDIRMPGLSGLEAAAAMADEWPQDADAAFPLIVFVTAYDQYALKAFDVQAADYIVKPVQRERLEACVTRLRNKIADRSMAPAGPSALIDAAIRQLRGLIEPAAAASGARLDVIQAASGSTVRLVPVDDVLYFEAADKYVRVVTAQAEHLIRLSLRELLPQLDAQRFWQVHRGLVVQAREIDSAVRDETGRVTLTLRRRPERLTASRMYAHRFRGM
jgi:DNA-binding LytR/AlgR family response regulator